MSQRQNPHFSREGFQPLTHTGSNMSNPNDVTISIPMEKVSSRATTGARKATFSPSVTQPPGEFPDTMNEKHGFFSHGRGRRKKIDAAGNDNKDKADGSLTLAGRIYSKIYNFSIITRYMLYVIPVAILIAVPLVLGATLFPNARIGGVKMLWFFVWVEVVWVSLWVSKLFAQFLPYLFQFLCGVVSPGTRKYASILIRLEIPLSLVGWAATSLATWAVLMTQNPDARARGETGLKPWQSVVKNILFATLFATLVLLAEKVLIQLISISYHRKSFDDKIKESKQNLYLLGLLYDASRTLFPLYCSEFAEEDYTISDTLGLESGKSSRQGHVRSGSATPMKIIHNIGRVKDNITTAFGSVAQEITGKQVFNPNAAHSIIVQALEKKHTSEALARRIWLSFVLEGRDALYVEDFHEVLGPDRQAEADEAFICLDVDGNGDVSLDEMILRLSEFSRERHSITNSMHDVDQAIHVLDNLLMTVVFVLVVAIYVAFLNKNFTTTLATTGTALLSLSFVFAATAQEVLGSCIFLFVKHPFDVGDRVDIADNQYVVDKISLLYTTFRRVQDYKKTQVPNIVLNSVWIDNVSRSKAMREQVNIYVSFDTSLEDIELLKKELQCFVQDKDNARDFQPEVEVEVTGLAEMNKLELRIDIRHKSNWANEAVRASRRSKFMCALVLALRRVPIYAPGGGSAPAGDKANPTYSVAISDEEARQNAGVFKDDKDKKRMVPLLQAEDADVGKSTSVDMLSKVSSGGGAGEEAALQGLNKRSMAADPARDDEERENTLERQRSNDIESVRGMLRRESTTGRRRAANHTLSPPPDPRFGARTIPTIPDASPMEPVDAPSTAPRVSYFEDNSYKPAPLAPGKGQGMYQQQPAQSQHVRRDTGGLSAHPPARVESATIPSMYETPAPQQGGAYQVPGNAFAQQQQYQQQQHQQQLPQQTTTRQRSDTETSLQRRPVPGMGEMKDYLQSPK
jgi:hypothetical protein